MKKSLFMAALVAAAMSSCTSDEALSPAQLQNAEAEALGLERVNLSLTTAAASVTETRANAAGTGIGTGTVGGTTAGTNKFNFEDVYVLMMDLGTDGTWANAGDYWSFSNCGGSLGEQFNNTFICRPLETETNTELKYNDFTNGALKYYPLQKYNDFFGYYIDNAANDVDANGNPVLYNGDGYEIRYDGTTELKSYLWDGAQVVNDPQAATPTPLRDLGEKIVLPFTIDGSQDIMVGKATNYPGPKRGFSGTTARVDVIPLIQLKHMLTRFTFDIKSGDNSNATTQLAVDTISIFSKSKGTLTVAAKNIADFDIDNGEFDINSLIEWDAVGNDPVEMYLTQQDGAAPAADLANGKPEQILLEEYAVGAKDTRSVVGDAFFVKPGENLYTIKLYLSQKAQTGTIDDDGDPLTPEVPVLATQWADTDLDLVLPEDPQNPGVPVEFERAKSYHVVITVYGLHDITVKAELEQWTDGEELNLSTEDED